MAGMVEMMVPDMTRPFYSLDSWTFEVVACDESSFSSLS
jgi:hypothetical protein